MDASADPSTPSPAHVALAATWQMIRAVLAGIEQVRAAGETYLPSFPAESQSEYDRRLKMAPWRPEFEDAVRGIVAKPFSKEVTLAGEPSEETKALAEDIDGRGNNLHNFAKSLFEDSVPMGAAGILVDHPPLIPDATKADEQQTGARPYWVLVRTDDIIALRTERRGAREIVNHLRIRESKIIIDGFSEVVEDRIRVIEPGMWEVYKPKTNPDGAVEWELEDSGLMTLDEVPFVFFATGQRVGPHFVRPPLYDLAHMQIELYQGLSNEEEIYTVAGSPMLTANGMGAPENGSEIETGPRRVLYAPGAEGIQTSWQYLQPDAANLEQVSKRNQRTAEDMRRLGLQPLMPSSGDVTATATGIEAAKSHTAVGTWANGCKDALEQAWVFTNLWRKSDEVVEVTVHTDFAAGIFGAEEIRLLIEARDKGQISEETFFDEMMRRGFLGPQFNKDEERTRLEEEMPSEEDIIATALPPPNQNPPPPEGG